MKGLLHSKKFRTNLYKWLFAYVGVLLLLTVVVTYSKYISDKTSSDKARSAIFTANFNKTTSCNENALNNVCVTLKTYRPTSSIEYEFSFDTVGTEVDTYLVLRTTVDSGFTIEDFLIDGISYKTYNNPSTNVILENNAIKVTSTIKANAGTLNNYKVIVKYKNNNLEQFPEAAFQSYIKDVTKIVQVSYSANQIAPGGVAK